MNKKILVVIPMSGQQKQALAEAAPGCDIVYGTPESVTEQQVQDAQIILGNVPAKLIQASPKLELLQLNSAGTDPYLPAGVLAESTVLTNATGAYSKAVAEHMFAMMFSLMKKLHLYRDAQNRQLWQDEGSISSITDATVLVVGLGDIGLYFSRMCKALGAHVIGVKRRPGHCPEGVDELYLTAELDKALPRADVVVSFLPNTADTKGCFDLRRLSLMKKNAILLNGGRGNAIVTDDLYAALRDGLIFAAGVDVTDPEPLPPEHPLWKQPNMLITPHVAGGYHLAETLERIVNIAIRNTEAHLLGRSLENVVDMSTGYKK